MGIFSKIADLGRNGPDQSIQCKTCGTTYRGNVDGDFPYAICGRCLENAGNDAKSSGDNNNYRKIVQEFRRRGSNWK